ncbi:/ / DegV domain-containing protein / 73061:73933 Reverse [Candidatus Hepatoplasma crinochetorum]|uniref:/ / DegV domain-containing protein / 73061:73933 Reverse n=1 Tax=Candidatus Hepatoplasma crinochetorum TaxID=295596 RepID=A0A0G7ZND1_9MOLU|nr:/ / DegV domain-containing protein / 73061:73933 Reverse [Candidatus Hepatoplasma crinochetorum]
MKKGLLIDSSTGLTKKQAEEMGFYYTSLIINIDGKEYKSGIDIDNKFLLDNMNLKTKVQTSTAKLGDVEQEIKKALKEVDQLLIITISKYLSSMNSMIKVLADDDEYKEKVFVFDSNFITPWIYHELPNIKKWIKNDDIKMNFIIEKLSFLKDKMNAFLIPDTLVFLYAGGRITKAQYIAGSFLKVLPIIVVRNGRIDSEDVIKKRTVNKAYDKAIEILKKQYNNWIKKGYRVELKIINLNSDKNFEILKEKLAREGFKKFEETIIAPEIVAHVGPRATGFGLIVHEKNT